MSRGFWFLGRWWRLVVFVALAPIGIMVGWGLSAPLPQPTLRQQLPIQIFTSDPSVPTLAVITGTDAAGVAVDLYFDLRAGQRIDWLVVPEPPAKVIAASGSASQAVRIGDDRVRNEGDVWVGRGTVTGPRSDATTVSGELVSDAFNANAGGSALVAEPPAIAVAGDTLRAHLGPVGMSCLIDTWGYEENWCQNHSIPLVTLASGKDVAKPPDRFALLDDAVPGLPPDTTPGTRFYESDSLTIAESLIYENRELPFVITSTSPTPYFSNEELTRWRSTVAALGGAQMSSDATGLNQAKDQQHGESQFVGGIILGLGAAAVLSALQELPRATSRSERGREDRVSDGEPGDGT